MPKIPIYQKQVQTVTPQAQMPTFRRPSDIAPAMNASNAAVRDYGETINKVTSLLSQRIAEQNQMESETNIANHESMMRVDVQKLLNNERGDGFLDRQYDQAKGISTEFNDSFNKLKQQYMDSLDGDYQRDKFNQSITNHYAQTSAQVNRHEATEFSKGYNLSIDSNIKLRQAQAAAITDPEILRKEIAAAQELSTSRDMKNGLDAGSVELNRLTIGGEMAKTSINAILEQNPIVAKNIFNSVKDTMTPEQQALIESNIRGKEIGLRAQNTWESMKNMTLSDGRSDQARMEKTIFSDPKSTIEEKNRIWNYVKAKSNEKDSFKLDREQANNTTFLNNVIENKNKGISLDESLKLIGGAALNAKDGYDKEEVVRKIYSREDPTSPTTYMLLWEAVKDRKINKAELDQELKLGNINSKTWIELNQDLYNVQKGNINEEEKLAWDNVKLLAEKEIGSKEKRDTFLYMTKLKTQGKEPGEVYSTAKQLLSEAPSTGLFGSNFYAEQQYKSEFKKIEKGVDLSVKYGKESVNNAIEALRKRGKSIDPQYIEKVLNKYPNGLVP